MNDYQQNNQSVEAQPHAVSTHISGRHQRIAERRKARAANRCRAWIGDGILIVASVLIMLKNLDVFILRNWWALFILIPAVGAFGNAFRLYGEAHRIGAAARASLISGTILAMIAAIFLLGLNFTLLGPALLILAGIGLVLNTALPG